jgi:glycosyltransferase involved in cell wall biosynthesis
MRASLWFIVPVFGRESLTRICLGQLRRTCDALAEDGIEATAICIGDDDNLTTARDLGFGTIRRDNLFLSRKYNDGIQVACDPEFNPRPADYVVPCGSDDWVHPSLFVDLPPPDRVYGFQRMSFVREDGCELTTHFLDYEGGCGIRIYPREIVRAKRYRPADEDRKRGCDTSILLNLKRARRLFVEHRESDAYEIVDWKSHRRQVNSYAHVAGRHRGSAPVDPFDVLADFFPSESLDEMRAHYRRPRERVIA